MKSSRAGLARRDPGPNITPVDLGVRPVPQEDPRATRRIRALFDHLAGTLTDYLDVS